ncbi:hypothetical protein DFP73DRAFT_258564 [Morchella snyderi]|nr:hypothetical protein DFP73DRAFT_258564 [Morchella snyderi]
MVTSRFFSSFIIALLCFAACGNGDGSCAKMSVVRAEETISTYRYRHTYCMMGCLFFCDRLLTHSLAHSLHCRYTLTSVRTRKCSCSGQG